MVGNFLTTGWEEESATVDTFMEEVKTYTAFKNGIFLDNYWFPILVPIGVLGNTLSFIVIMKPTNRNVSICIYMAAISLNDNVIMYVSAHVYLVVGLKIHEWHLTECRFFGFLVLYALQNSRFQVLAITIDKYIAIKWPHTAALYSTPRRARMIAIGLSICAIIYNSPHLYLSHVGNQCTAYGVSSLIAKVYSWFSFVLNAIIPFILLIHMNYVIVQNVRISRKLFKNK